MITGFEIVQMRMTTADKGWQCESSGAGQAWFGDSSHFVSNYCSTGTKYLGDIGWVCYGEELIKMTNMKEMQSN